MPVAPRRVFEVLSDPRNLPSWVDPVESVSRDAGGWTARYRLPDLTADCRCDLRLRPESLRVEWTVHLPGGREVRAAAGVKAAAGGACSCELTVDSPPVPPFAVADEARVLRRRLEKNLEKLRALAQGKTADAGPAGAKRVRSRGARP